MATKLLELFRRRRSALGMSFVALSQRSRVPVSTLKRIFGDGLESASFSNLTAIAEAMGIDIHGDEQEPSVEFREQAAAKKATQLVSIVQATSALESQAVGAEFVSEMVRHTVHDLMAGSTRRLWSA